MNRALLILNTVVLVLLLAMAVPMALSLLNLRSDVDGLAVQQAELQTLAQSTRHDHGAALTALRSEMTQLDAEIAQRPTADQVQADMAKQAEATNTRLAATTAAVTELDDAFAAFTREQAAATERIGQLSDALDQLRRLQTGEQVDITGAWTLHNKPKPNTIPVSIVHEGGDRYRLNTPAVSRGVYVYDGDSLRMVEPGSDAYDGFVWKVLGPNQIELTTTQYRGSRLVRGE